MSVKDMFGMDGFDSDQSRYERNNRMNPAEYAPGMGSFESQDAFGTNPFGDANNDPFGGNNMSGMNDPFSSGGMGGDPFGGGMGGDPFGGGMGGDPFSSGGMGGDPFGSGGMGGGNPFGNNPFLASNDVFANPNNMNGMQMQQPQNALQQYSSEEDKIFAAIGKGAKESVGFIKELVTAIQDVTPRWYLLFGRNLAVDSGIFSVIGFVFMLFGLKVGTSMIVAGLLGASVGLLTMAFNTEKAKNYDTLYKDEMPQQSMDFSNDGFDNQSAMGFDNQPEMDWGSSDFDTSSNEPDLDWGDSSNESDNEEETEEESNIWDNIAVEEEVVEQPKTISTEEALANLQEIPPHMYTRQYLYDAICNILPNIKPDFSDMKTIDEDDNVFLYWGDCLREAAEVSGCKQENLPELLQLQETMFTIIVTCTRPTGFKADAVAQELAQQYAYQDGTFNQNVFATANTVGKKCIITIFTGQAAMVSLKDMMDVEKKWVLNPKVTIPVIFGIDQVGTVIKADVKKLESIIITGMPRSGKSWFVKAVLLQMCMFNSPNELQFYICDPKDGISDFKSFNLPQVKKFVSGDESILETVRQVVKVEGPRRKKLIGAANCVNIWDFKEQHPEVQLPVIYVVIDEVVTLAERMEKEIKQEFQGLIVELISQLPAVGIRTILIPHVIKDQIIAKTASDLVPCKISIMGDADHIEKATGSKYKDFPYKLSNLGDMAVKMPLVSSNTLYVHAPVITPSNPENDKIFQYLRVVWNKIEPDEKETEKLQNEVEEQIALQTVDIDTSSMSDDEMFSDAGSLF